MANEKEILRSFAKYIAEAAKALNYLYPRVLALEALIKNDPQLEPNYKRHLVAAQKQAASSLGALSQFAEVQQAIENLPN